MSAQPRKKRKINHKEESLPIEMQKFNIKWRADIDNGYKNMFVKNMFGHIVGYAKLDYRYDCLQPYKHNIKCNEKCRINEKLIDFEIEIDNHHATVYQTYKIGDENMDNGNILSIYPFVINKDNPFFLKWCIEFENGGTIYLNDCEMRSFLMLFGDKEEWMTYLFKLRKEMPEGFGDKAK